MRVLVAGMGSAIGTGITRVLERNDAVEAIAGFDLEPPRRWMRRADFQFVRPGDSERVTEIVRAFEPTHIVNAWVFEPRARSSPGQARARTVGGTETLLGAIAKVDTIERIVTRSGVSIYGRGRDTPEFPTIDTAPRPTSTFGELLLRVEERCRQAARSCGASMAAVRVAPIMASNLPNTLGRYLRLKVVPVPITNKRFGVIHLDDAAATIAAAAVADFEGPINVMAEGEVTPLEAVAIGRRLPVPVLPAAFRLGRGLAELSGAPLTEHVAELLTRGQVVDRTDVTKLLGVRLTFTTEDTVRHLYSTGRLLEYDETADVARYV